MTTHGGTLASLAKKNRSADALLPHKCRDSSIPLFMSITTANDDGGGESSAYLSLKSRFKIS